MRIVRNIVIYTSCLLIMLSYLAGRASTNALTFAIFISGMPIVLYSFREEEKPEIDPERLQAEKLAWNEIRQIEKKAGL